MIINEIFYSLQGEGHFTGVPAIFIRFAGCNLACPFCDTDHSEGVECTITDLIGSIFCYPCQHVVITGGEPSMQLTEEIVDALHQHGYFVQVETNGTLPLPANVDWITCSPKGAPVVHSHVNELKVLYNLNGYDRKSIEGVTADHYYLQPCDVKHPGRNAIITGTCVEYIKRHPEWRLSLQTHKLINIR